MLKLAGSFFLFLLVFADFFVAKAQDESRICVLFTDESKYINVVMSNDSTFSRFSIVEEGYETKEKRIKTRKKYRNDGIHVPIPIHFYYNYYTSGKPIHIISIDHLNKCATICTIDKFRLEYNQLIQRIGGGIIFIKKLETGVYLKWDVAIMMMII